MDTGGDAVGVITSAKVSNVVVSIDQTSKSYDATTWPDGGVYFGCWKKQPVAPTMFTEQSSSGINCPANATTFVANCTGSQCLMQRPDGTCCPSPERIAGGPGYMEACNGAPLILTAAEKNSSLDHVEDVNIGQVNISSLIFHEDDCYLKCHTDTCENANDMDAMRNGDDSLILLNACDYCKGCPCTAQCAGGKGVYTAGRGCENTAVTCGANGSNASSA